MSARKTSGRGGARKGSGRKPKPADEKQRHAIPVHLTNAEREALEDAAGDEPLATFVRRLLLRYLRRRRG